MKLIQKHKVNLNKNGPEMTKKTIKPADIERYLY